MPAAAGRGFKGTEKCLRLRGGVLSEHKSACGHGNSASKKYNNIFHESFHAPVSVLRSQAWQYCQSFHAPSQSRITAPRGNRGLEGHIMKPAIFGDRGGSGKQPPQREENFATYITVRPTYKTGSFCSVRFRAIICVFDPTFLFFWSNSGLDDVYGGEKVHSKTARSADITARSTYITGLFCRVSGVVKFSKCR